MTSEKKISEHISDFLNFLTQVESTYSDSFEEMKRQENLTQDFLHMMELGELSYSERNKLATKIVANRKDRRFYKDKVEEYKPIIDFLADQNNKKIINQLKRVLGDVRKVENYHSRRFYVPKVLDKKEDVCTNDQ